jgi:hypothetical protein
MPLAADGGDTALGLLHQAHRLGRAEQPLQGEVLGRPGQRAAAIATTGAGAADVGLDQQHIQLRRLLLEHQRSPQPGIATADDAHIATLIACQRRTQRLAFLLQSLLQPERSHLLTFL